MAAKKEEQATAETKAKVVFSKDQILKMKRYANRIDLLGVLLEEGEEYAFSDVDGILNKFMNGGKR